MNSGIYQIINVLNGKKYIGSAVDVDERFRLHLLALRNKNHHNMHLQNAWNKDSEEKFKFEILEKCEKALLINREQYYFDALKPEYNICPIAGNTLGADFYRSSDFRQKQRNSHLGHRRTKESKKKQSIAMKGNKSRTGMCTPESVRKKISVANKGKKHSEEWNAKISASRLGIPPWNKGLSLVNRKRALI